MSGINLQLSAEERYRLDANEFGEIEHFEAPTIPRKRDEVDYFDYWYAYALYYNGNDKNHALDFGLSHRSVIPGC